MAFIYYQVEIARKLKERLETVLKTNGYSQDLKTIAFDKVKINISDYQDYELPAAQFIDLSELIAHEMSRSKTEWTLALEICMRTTETIGTVDQEALWKLRQDCKRAIMADPKLGLNYVIHTKLIDGVTDLHLHEPNYIATIGLVVTYYEPITRENC